MHHGFDVSSRFRARAKKVPSGLSRRAPNDSSEFRECADAYRWANARQHLRGEIEVARQIGRMIGPDGDWNDPVLVVHRTNTFDPMPAPEQAQTDPPKNT